MCCLSEASNNIPNFSPSEIYSSAAEFVKAVGQRYGNKQFSEESSKPPAGEGATGGGTAAATAGSAGGSGGTAKPPSGGGGDGGKQSSTAAGGKSGGCGLDMDGHYAECSPGGMEEYDATYDSDEDVDFSKMDMVSYTYSAACMLSMPIMAVPCCKLEQVILKV